MQNPSIVFVENREKTALWAAIAARLEAAGCRIHWIVQNPVFHPSDARDAYQLSNERRGPHLTAEEIAKEFPLLLTERGRCYMGSGSAHYRQAYSEIHSALDTIRPLAVFGEATLFHELLTIQAAEALGIAYYHPSGERYQNDRCLFFAGATMEPAVAGPDRLDRETAMKMVQTILDGGRRPLYMQQPRGLAATRRRMQWFQTRFSIWRGRLAGEVHNTPALSDKLRLWRHQRVNKRRWDAMARPTASPRTTILYPLQMQPEANIEVWGAPYSDQVELIKRLADAAPAGTTIAVKSNPKWKYEVDDRLLSLMEARRDIVPLPRSMAMDDARAATAGAITVTGTIGHEAVFGLNSCISLRHPVLTEHFPQFAAGTPEEAVEKLLRNPDAARGNPDLGAELLQYFYAHSFPGYILDPFNWPFVLEATNVDILANAFMHCLEHATSVSKPN